MLAILNSSDNVTLELALWALCNFASEGTLCVVLCCGVVWCVVLRPNSTLNPSSRKIA